ncbi:MAG: nucleotidyltransferase family protein [Candidatus Helarchaeota archaeon]
MELENQKIKQKILSILKRNGAKKIGLFGSFVRGELKENSDIDILVEIDKDISLLDYIGIKLELEEELGRKVDLVEYKLIKPSLKQQILKEQVVIL